MFKNLHSTGFLFLEVGVDERINRDLSWIQKL